MTVLTELLNNVTETNNYELCLDVFPQLHVLKSTPQDSFYHAEGDVWTHTKMVLDCLIEDPTYQSASNEQQFIMFYGALLHDVSKPTCTKIENDGGISSKGHSRMGAIDTRSILWRMDVPFLIREEICNIISVHQVPFFAFDDKGTDSRPVRTPEFIAMQLSQDMSLKNLITVATADMNGRFCAVKQKALDDIELFTEVAKETNCYEQSYIFPDEVTKYEYFQRFGKIAPFVPFYKEHKCNVHVMVGLPASGKDTYVATHLSHLPVISFDDAKKELGLTHRDNPGQAVQLVQQRAKQYLAKGQEFVWNATHISRQMREKTINLLNQYDAHITVHYMEVGHSTLMERNNSRDAHVPKEFYEKLFHKWEIPLTTESHKLVFHVE